MQTVQELLVDYNKQKEYSKWLLSMHRKNDIEFFNEIYFTDRAWFHLDGFINA